MINSKPVESLSDLFGLKCKRIRSIFNKLKFPTSKDSLDFKFNFYKSLSNLSFNSSINITSSEVHFLKKFKYEKPFKIIDCDKNVGVCFIDINIYNSLVLEHLNDSETYKKLTSNPLDETNKIIYKTLESLKKNKHLSKSFCSKLYNKNSKLGCIRLLAKLHKTTLSFRPIIKCLSHPLIFICLLIDLILQPFVKKTSSFILDSQNLIQKSLNKFFPINSKLYSCDFESLYTNINLEDALKLICEFISKNLKSDDISAFGFHELLKLVFENNVFEFNGYFFKQISGIAMGAKCAPSIANFYLSILEEKFLTIHRPLFYYRFIDDIFVILDNLFNINLLTNNFNNLKLNVVSEKSVVFLDLIIQLDPNTGLLNFSLYTKKTNTFSYLLSTSNHPNFIFNNIPKSLFIRIRRICSFYSDFLFFSRRLVSQLVNRGYNKYKILKVFRMVSNLDRNSLIPYKPKKEFSVTGKIFFTFPFELNTQNIKVAYNSAFNSISSSKALENTQFRLINNMQSNLSSLFVHDFKLFSPKSHFYSKCNVKTCTPCAYANSSTFLKLNDFILPIMSNSNCKSKNILYIINCKLCNCYYIGQSMSAKGRLKSHIRAVRLNRTTSNCVCVYQHFNSPNHNTLNYFTFYIFKTDIDNKFQRLSLETQLIHLFLKLGMILLNEKIPDLYFSFPNVSLFN